MHGQGLTVRRFKFTITEELRKVKAKAMLKHIGCLKKLRLSEKKKKNTHTYVRILKTEVREEFIILYLFLKKSESKRT